MAHRSIKGIEETLAMMKQADNRWADKYVMDVGHLLMKLKESNDAAFQAGADAARRECAGTLTRRAATKSDWLTPSEKAILKDSAARIVARVGRPVKGEK